MSDDKWCKFPNSDGKSKHEIEPGLYVVCSSGVDPEKLDSNDWISDWFDKVEEKFDPEFLHDPDEE
jgi:hypothetical protein